MGQHFAFSSKKQIEKINVYQVEKGIELKDNTITFSSVTGLTIAQQFT